MSAPLAAVDLEGPVTDGFRAVATFVPKLIGFLVILLVGYLVARVVAGVVDKVLERVGFDRAVERGGIKRALAQSDYDASDIVAKIAFYFVFVAALSMALATLDIAALEQPMAQLLALLPKVLVALVVFVIGAALAAGAKSFLTNVLGGLPYGSALATAVAGIVLVLFGKAALDEVGIATQLTNALLYTVLAIIAGVTIVGVGGGLIGPMSRRWESIIDRGQQETQRAKQQVSGGASTYPTDPMTSSPETPDPMSAPVAFEDAGTRTTPTGTGQTPF